MLPINVKKIFAAEVVALSANASSAVIKMTDSQFTKGDAPAGNFSLYVDITDNGTAKFEYLISLDGTNYIDPSGAADILVGMTKTGGRGGAGEEIAAFSPVLAPYIKVKVTETGGANQIIVTAYLAWQ